MKNTNYKERKNDILFNTIKGKKIPLSINIILIAFLYNMFALNRIKYTLNPMVDRIEVSNVIWILPVLLSIIFFIKLNRNHGNFDKFERSNIFFILSLYLLVIIIIVGGFKAISIQQYYYAILTFLIPIGFYFVMTSNYYSYVGYFIKFFLIIGIIYSIIAIISSMNYESIMSLLGNSLRKQYTVQYRASLMLGSSITVSYYLNITLPICFLTYYIFDDKFWKRIALIGIISNIIATTILLSRAAFLCSILVVIYFLFFIDRNKKTRGKKILLFVLLIITIIYIGKEFDISRLFMGFSGQSTNERLKSSELGIQIFKNNPLIGSGMGNYFTRAYNNKEIIYGDYTGLVDPHNMYVLTLSEMGIIGLACVILIVISLFLIFSKINNRIIKQTANITLIVFLIGGTGGSHIFNEMGYSTIFWMYMGLYKIIALHDYKEKKEVII